jgi:hypothetical protein
LASDLTSIITELQQQRAAIERALSVLREIGSGGIAAPTPAKRRGRPPGSKNQGASVEARNRRSEGQRRRWAAKRASETPAPAKPAAKKSGLTAAGRKRLSEMMKARWASKNPPKAGAKKKAARLFHRRDRG